MLTRRAVLAASLAAAAPARAQFSRQRPAPIRVLASFSILADIAAKIADERGAVGPLVPAGGDAHAFQPSPADAARVAQAKLILVNGLGYDGWMERLAASAGATDRVVVASKGVAPLSAGRGVDPHAWQSVPMVKRYVETIRAGLDAADPDGEPSYAGNARTYLKQLDLLDAEIRAAVAALPRDRRTVVTTHDAFGYFAAEYGLSFVAPKGVSTEAEASPKDVARIIRQIREEKIPAVFLENVADPRLIERIAQETGAKIGGALYSDSLSPPKGPATTYLDMMRHNIRELTRALAP